MVIVYIVNFVIGLASKFVNLVFEIAIVLFNTILFWSNSLALSKTMKESVLIMSKIFEIAI